MQLDPGRTLINQPLAAATPPPRDKALKEAAVALEASFLAEMLQHAGLGDASESFGGGAGEEQFASFLRTEQARAMAHAGGIGLSQALFDAFRPGGDDGH